MKLTYSWSGSVFTAESHIEIELLQDLVDTLVNSGYEVITPQESSRHVPEWNAMLGELWIPGE